MRRPSLNAKQRAFAREQRALRALRRAAVRLTNAVDSIDQRRGASVEADAYLDLEIAAMKYANTITTRERRRLSK